MDRALSVDVLQSLRRDFSLSAFNFVQQFFDCFCKHSLELVGRSAELLFGQLFPLAEHV